ncbi:CpsD/CapB family tyrosine-protein kinase [Myxococcota bacterium]|nr:CpsD/CapB family tyrosine-protein kinase [Myxococcota bacterium]MCZ7618495.1 CpsD/CapB family tyrosine-protein kinase [Myxococcota bacterium]
MGKVYDALRRAESQRSERRAPPAGFPTPMEPLAAPPGPAADDHRAGQPAREQRGRFARLLRTLRRDPAETTRDDAGAINKRRIALLQPDSFVAEQFRTLRARLDSLAAERPIRTIAITSALPGEGKTTASINLALVSAMAVGRRVLLVDCDLRRPKVHSALGLRPELGLAEVLMDQATAERAICKVEGSALEVLPVRGTPSNPAELLASPRMRSLVEELARGYDQVIFDTPPTLSLPDAKVVSELVDGVVLVVRADQTPEDDVQATLDVLDRRRLLGVVLNGAETDTQRYGY